MTLLTVCDDVATEVGIVRPTAVVSSTDPNVIKLLRLAQKSGELLAKRHDWQDLLIMHTWTATATQTQASGPPSATDYDRLEYNADLWNRTQTLRYCGPLGGNSWSNLLTQTASGVTGYWRIIRGVLNIYPVPTAGNTLAMPYLSNKWILDNDGSTYKASFNEDTDTVLFPEYLLKLDMVWRWKQSNGLDYAEDMSDFERALDREAARDAGTRVLVPRQASQGDMPPVPGWYGVITGV